MAHAHALACFWHHVGNVRHAFETAGDGDINGAGDQRVMALHGGFHAGTAKLVDRCRTSRIWNASEDRCLTGRALALTVRQHAAHDHFIHICRCNARPLQRSFNCSRTQVWATRVRKDTVEAAHGRAGHTDNDDGIVRHKISPELRFDADYRAGLSRLE